MIFGIIFFFGIFSQERRDLDPLFRLIISRKRKKNLTRSFIQAAFFMQTDNIGWNTIFYFLKHYLRAFTMVLQ